MGLWSSGRRWTRALQRSGRPRASPQGSHRSGAGSRPISLAEEASAPGPGTRRHFGGRLLRGKLCIDPEVREGIIIHVVEDEQGFRYYLFLCNFASSWWTEKEARVWFPRHARVAIRDPVVSFAKDDVPCVEVLNPASIQLLGMDLQDDPSKLAADALRNKEFVRAALLFSNVLDCCESGNEEEKIAAVSSRSEAWLQAGAYDRALEDAETALKLQPDHRCSSGDLLRKARVLMQLHDYKKALECFESAGDSSRDAERCKRFFEHSERGIFDLDDYYLNLESRESTPECGEFVGDVRIGIAPDGKGRGLFATRGSSVLLPSMQDSEKIPDESDLLAQMIRNCLASRRSLEQLVSLVDSEEIPELDLFKPNRNWESRIEGISSVDIPSCARKTSIDYGYKFERVIGRGRRREFLSGLWILTAFANHSCSPSATQKAVGSDSLVRAARDLNAGDEITLAYLDPFMPWDVRSRQTKSRWGFECACERCRFESKLHPDLMNLGSKIEKMIEEPSNLDLFELSEMACKVEKMINKWKGPGAERNKQWMRAAYYKAYEVYLLNRDEFEKFMTRLAPPPWETMMEALRFTAPGYEGLLNLLVVFAQHSGSSSKARELLVEECVSCFGKLRSATVETILRREEEHCARSNSISSALGFR